MAVADPCVKKEWEEWKKEMVEKRRRWGERVNYWTKVAVNGNEKDDCVEEEAEDTASEEEAVEETGEEEEEEKGMKMREAGELAEDEENELGRGHKKRDEEEGDEVIEADEKVAVERDEVDAQEEMMLVQVDKWQEEKKVDREMECRDLAEVVEEREVMEVEEMEEEQEEGEHEFERDIVVNEYVDEDEDKQVRGDKQVQENNDDEEELQDLKQNGQCHLAELLRQQITEIEDENIHQDQASTMQEDKTVSVDENVSDSLESEDFDLMESKDECYNFERKMSEGKAEKHCKDPEELENPAAKSLKDEKNILEEEDPHEKFADEVGTIAESQTQAELLQDDLKTLQEEEEASSDEEETENSADEDINDEDEVKIYRKDDYLTEVFGTLREFRDSSILTDLTLSTVDGRSCHVHSPVLAAVSSHIWESLSERNHWGVNGWSVSLGPEVDHVGLEAVVEFAYTGLIPCLNKDTMHLIKAAAEALGAPKVLDLCADKEEKSTKVGGQKKEEGLSAAEQMMMSFQAIKKLRNERVGCDVILEGIGGSLHVHRVILAVQSDYFHSMFTLAMKESHQPRVNLPFLLASELEVLIDCSYSGALPLSWSCVFEVTSSALQLQYQPALSLCLDFLQQEINPHSCLDVASFAEAYEMTQLLEVAEDFALRQFYKVACTSKFKDLPAKQLLRYLNSHSLCVSSELVVFKAVVAWIQARPKKRLKFTKELMKTIYFPLMTFSEFKEVRSLNIWSEHNLAELYEAIFEDFCGPETAPQSQCRIYLPKQSLILIGGDQTSEDLGTRSISRELWFGNSLRNHTGIKKAMEWRRLAEMPDPGRFKHEVAVLEGQLYVFGGKKYYGTYDTLSSVYRFDPLQNSWEKLAEMQEKRCSFSVVVVDGKIYAIGGHCEPDYLESVEQYCSITNSWSFTRRLDLPLSAHVAKALNGQIFVSGGLSNDYQCLASMFVYHPQTGSSYLANMLRARAQHCMEILGECLYAAGGITADDSVSVLDLLACEVYNPAANCWTAFTSLPVPHVGAGSAILEGKFYVLGGYSQEDYGDTTMVHRYDPTTQRWENVGKMPGPNNDIRASLLSLPPHLRL